jgi:hypothetical protein
MPVIKRRGGNSLSLGQILTMCVLALILIALIIGGLVFLVRIGVISIQYTPKILLLF